MSCFCSSVRNGASSIASTAHSIVSGDLGYVLYRIYPHRFKYDDEVIESDYKGVAIWEKIDDQWKIIVACYNRNPKVED